MEATAVSLARSVLDGVLSTAGTAVADEVARLAALLEKGTLVPVTGRLSAGPCGRH